MNYRRATILAGTDVGASGTKTIDISIRDIISRIIIGWRITKSQHGMSAPCWTDIEKIELVDGSDVLHGIDGQENQALCIYDRRCPTMNDGVHLNGIRDWSTYGIDFGRFLYDPELALDPAKFRNLQLKITYTQTGCDDGASENELHVYAECFDEKVVSPIGFLMSKELWSAAAPTSGYEYIDLPTDFPIRKILLKAFTTNIAPWDVITSARIDEDNEKRIPFDYDSLEEYYSMMKGVWRPVEENCMGVTGASNYFYLTPTDYMVLALGIGLGNSRITQETWSIGGKTLPANQIGGAVFFQMLARGYLPNHCFEFPFGKQDDLDDWYDVTRLGSLRLRLGAGGTDPTDAAIVLQQLRRY